jgi:hypothetical protein
LEDKVRTKRLCILDIIQSRCLVCGFFDQGLRV